MANLEIPKAKFVNTGYELKGKQIFEAQHATGVVRIVGEVPAKVELEERVINGNKVMIALAVRTINAFDFSLIKDADIVSTVGAENVSALLQITASRKTQYAK